MVKRRAWLDFAGWTYDFWVRLTFLLITVAYNFWMFLFYFELVRVGPIIDWGGFLGGKPLLSLSYFDRVPFLRLYSTWKHWLVGTISPDCFGEMEIGDCNSLCLDIRKFWAIVGGFFGKLLCTLSMLLFLIVLQLHYTRSSNLVAPNCQLSVGSSAISC